MSPEPFSVRSPRRIIATRLRPLVLALGAALLASGSVSPAIALSPAMAVAAPAIGASIAQAATPASPAALGLGSQGAAASAAGVAHGRPNATGSVHTGLRALPARPPKRPASPKAPAAIYFRGTNHVWIPALGIDRSTFSFPCSRTQAPANYVYRWGCAGSNNMYLIGHAYGVFKALHDAYYNGRLKVGLTAVYGDGAGRIHTYRVAWWRVVRPTTAAKWAWASLATPSMTLQTCLGANSEYRLMVRLVQVS